MDLGPGGAQKHGGVAVYQTTGRKTHQAISGVHWQRSGIQPGNRISGNIQAGTK